MIDDNGLFVRQNVSDRLVGRPFHTVSEGYFTRYGEATSGEGDFTPKVLFRSTLRAEGEKGPVAHNDQLTNRVVRVTRERSTDFIAVSYEDARVDD